VRSGGAGGGKGGMGSVRLVGRRQCLSTPVTPEMTVANLGLKRSAAVSMALTVATERPIQLAKVAWVRFSSSLRRTRLCLRTETGMCAHIYSHKYGMSIFFACFVRQNAAISML